jgi:hypothetical protein
VKLVSFGGGFFILLGERGVVDGSRLTYTWKCVMCTYTRMGIEVWSQNLSSVGPQPIARRGYAYDRCNLEFCVALSVLKGLK